MALDINFFFFKEKVQAYANEFRKKKILKKNKKLKEKKEIYSYEKIRSKREGNSHKNHEKKQVYQPCRFITAATFIGIPLPLPPPPPPQNQGYLDLVYISSQASFPNTA